MDMNEENKNAAEQQEEGTGMKGIIEEVNIDEEMRSAYIDYSMSVIVSRALPDARDGLKPVQRRVLPSRSFVRKRRRERLPSLPRRSTTRSSRVIRWVRLP